MNIMAENITSLRQTGLLPKLLGATALAFGIAAYSGQAPAADFDAAKHFKGKTIRMIVDFKPGGGTDLQARYFAGNWSKFLPGKPRITVSNLFPNPSGRNFVWKSKPDGLTLNFVASAGVGTELVDKTAKFEIAKFIQIGSHAKRDVVLLARGTVPYNSVPEAKGSKVKLILAEPIGSPADLDGKLLATGMLSMWFDVPLKIATVARSGTADTLLMLERGDVNGYIAGSQWYALPKLRPGWFKKGYLKPIADMGHPDSPSIPNSEIKMPIPNAMTWMNAEQKALWKEIVLPEVISGKGITAPPGTPDAIIKVLRTAYAKAVHDPKFSAGLVKIQRQPVAFISGEKMQKIVEDATVDFKKGLPRFKEIRKQVYNRYFKGLKIVKIPENIAGKITKVRRAGRIVMIGGHRVRMNSTRSKITIKGTKAERKALKAGMACSIMGGMRKGRYEAKKVTCK
jgi:tripartite-type tricarboxylate transporter receptor subunit TctC